VIAEVERLPRPALEALQLAGLRATILSAQRVPRHRERLAAAGVGAEDVRSVEDVRSLPFTTKADFRDTYPYGMLAVPLAEVVRIHASSGTTGKPTVVAYTAADLEAWTRVMARTVRAGAVGPGDVVQNAYGYGLFTGGLGFHYGAERAGAAVIPISGGFTERQLMAFLDLGSTVLCSTPSYALHLAEALEDAGVLAKDLRLRVGFFGAEPWTEAMRQAIESRLDLMALNIYGLSEVMGPGVAVECPERAGMHLAEDHFLAEIIDPETHEPLAPGRVGELVLTTLTKQAIPLLRYRTRDLTALDPAPCACGRTTARLARITGRSDDMLIVRGVNVFPSQVEHALLQLPEVGPHYLLRLTREGALDVLEVQVEVHGDIVGIDVVGIARRVERRLLETIGLSSTVTVLPARSLERSTGKARRVEDLRGHGGRHG
jgi:phenylacetate-CoA ligase